MLPIQPLLVQPKDARAGLALLLLTTLHLVSTNATGQTLVADINQAGDPTADFIRSGVYSLLGSLVFSANDGLVGTEPWISDGTPGGTQLLAEVEPQSQSANVGDFVEMGDNLYFRAYDRSLGCEIWSSDLQPGNASVVTDLNNAGGFSCPYRLTAAGDYVYFVSSGPGLAIDYGSELWRSDGTSGNQTVFDFTPGPDNTTYGYMTAFDDDLYFVADDGVYGSELWRVTEAGVLERLDAVDNGGGTEEHTNPLNLYAVNDNILLFSATHADGAELFRTNGTSTSQVADINPGGSSSFPRDFFKAGPNVFFSAFTTASGRELWLTDTSGTAASPVKDINFGTGASDPDFFVSFSGSAYFFADDGSDFDLWTTDGTEVGTTKIYDLTLAAGDLVKGAYSSDTQMWFIVERDSGVDPLELWRSDGTNEGTELIKSFADDFFSAATTQNGAFFMAASTETDGRELWRSDGTTGGTVMVTDHAEPGSDPDDLVALGSTLFFTAVDGAHDRELWMSDGTAEGTELRLDGDPAGSGFANFFEPAAFQGSLYYGRTTDAVGDELFFVNPTTEGLAHDIVSGPDSGDPGDLHAGPSRLFFSAYDEEGYYEVMASDGTTLVVVDTEPMGDDDPEEFFYYDGWTYMSSDSPSNGTELMRSNGLPGGTSLFVDINPTGSSSPEEFAEALGLMFFGARTEGEGVEPWVSDGTVAGTQPLGDLVPSGDSSDPYGFVESNGRVFFRADSLVNNDALYVTDGTPAGTMAVGTQTPQSDLIAVPGGVVFVGDDPFTGSELYFSDGMSIVFVKDIQAGSADAAILWLTAFDGQAYFQADDGVHGPELWTSDGTPFGTYRAADTRPGPGGSEPSELTVVADTLYFAANDGATGLELHSYKAPVPLFTDDFESGDTGAWSSTLP